MASPRKGTTIDARYKLQRKLGSGGMAEVWLATDTELDRDVAVKILYSRFAQDKEFVERFRREARSAAGLSHPNVVSVYDRGTYSDTYYISMEYVEGESLKDLIKDGMTTAAAVEVTRQVLEAARFAHRKGIVHRDFKPQNVLIDPSGRAMVADFGIASVGSSEITQTGSVMGTAQYLSPEQAQGKDVTERSDLYSIGVMLYESLTGHVPFEADSAVAVALKQVQETPRRPSALNPEVSPALDAVVMRALAKDPSRRFEDADAFIKALDAAEAAPGQPRPQDTAAFPVVGTAGDYDDGEYDDELLDADEERRRRRRRWIIAAIVVCAVAGLVAYLLTNQSPNQVEVPSVTGQSIGQAQEVLTHRGFEVETTFVDNGAAKGTVTEQDPLGGTKADEGSTVTLTVSGGPKLVAIPEVDGLSQGEATKQLEAAGFVVNVEKKSSTTVPKGRAIGTSPEAGTQISTGSTVKLSVSKGSSKVTVPNLTGLSTEAATAELENLHLVANIVQRDSSQPEGEVVDQTPGAGKQVKKNTEVTIFTSTGTVDVPNVVGQLKQNAITILRQKGFKVVTQPDTTAALADAGKVTNQYPPANSVAHRGDTITLSIGHPPPASP